MSVSVWYNMKFYCKMGYIHIHVHVNLRYLQLKSLKYKENKKNCDTFDHNFKKKKIYYELGIIQQASFCIIRWRP